MAGREEGALRARRATAPPQLSQSSISSLSSPISTFWRSLVPAADNKVSPMRGAEYGAFIPQDCILRCSEGMADLGWNRVAIILP